jgi:hypothetical protein
MNRVTGTYESGKVILDRPVDWRNGTLVIVEPGQSVSDTSDTCVDGSIWEDDPAALQQWLERFDSLEPVFAPEEQEQFAAALREAREQQKRLLPAWQERIDDLLK